MTDYASFKYGTVKFPVPTIGSGIGGVGASFLRDADPALFYTLEFYQSIIQTHVGTRLLAEVGVGGVDQIAVAVADLCPLNPEPYLTEDHFKYPLLAAYRKGSKFEWVGRNKHIVDDVEVVYVLPPMQAREAERIMPLLHAIVKVLDNRTEMGFDPAYTPSAPTGTAGEQFWTRAGVTSAGVMSAEYGGYAPTEKLYFPCVRLSLTLKERSDYAFDEFEDLDRIDVHEDLADPIQPTLLDVVEFSIYPAPTVTLVTPSTGFVAGGQTVVLTGTGFRIGRSYQVTFGGVAATSVVALSTTSLQCVTPAHDAFPTFLADVEVTDLIDGQQGTLEGGFTYTTDPAALALTAWFEDYDVGAASGNWPGLASAGTSGLRTMAVGVAPTQGTALNGHGTADFSGGKTLGGGAMSLYLTASEWSMWWLGFCPSGLLVPLADDVGFSWYTNLFTNFGVQAGVAQSGTATFADGAASYNAWQLIQADYLDSGDGSGPVRVRINGRAWGSATKANIASLDPILSMGAAFSTGVLASVGTSQTKFSDATHDAILERMRAWSALPLT